jgi:hypothetical protein
MQESTIMDASATNRTVGFWDRETGWSRTLNQIVRLPRKQQQLLVADTSKMH